MTNWLCNGCELAEENERLDNECQSLIAFNNSCKEEIERLRFNNELANSVIGELKGEKRDLLNAYNYASRIISTEHCKIEHPDNTEYEKGKVDGLIQAANILRIAFREIGE